jgi:hypothetical protein
MGLTPFFASPALFPDWRFENLADRDLLSLHVDDFWGVSWDQCSSTGCVNLPAKWTKDWQDLAAQAHASQKPIYLALSPLGERRTLARRVLADGSFQDHWLATDAIDGNGCYRFSSDTAAATYKAAYIGFLKYLVELIGPKYLSPTIEMNLPFVTCPSEKAAWIAWYADVYAALKVAYPTLVVFPTFQLESMYGITDAPSACSSGTSLDECFEQRLAEASTIPGDRIAFSTYPWTWRFSATASFDYPKDTFARVQAATTRKIWISETGWNSAPIRASYPHGSSGTCGDFIIPATFEVPALGTLGIANDMEHAAYLTWLLQEARTRKFEAVVWWLNRDFLDARAAGTCPCAPADGDTCKLTDLFFAGGAATGELQVRLFANMGLRHYDGTARPGYTEWKRALDRAYAP